MPTRVLVVDDSALMRKLLTELLGRDRDLEVVGAAADPYAARAMIKATNPDVLTLDVEMPRMDGLTFLRNLMRLRPMPVVMVSSLTERGADATLIALSLGAIDFVAKPRLDVVHGLSLLGDEIVAKVKAAAKATPQRLVEQPAAVAKPDVVAGLRTTDKVIAIGASTGGTEAIARVLAKLPADSPGVVIAQHIPAEFSARFAVRLDGLSALTVREARDGDPILVGHAYVAPGHSHLRVVRSGARYVCALGDDAPVNRHRPSVDVLFGSVADQVGGNAVGILLTGMGADGAAALGTMRERGAPTIAQDKESSVVWGMPGEAVARGAAAEVLTLDAIAGRTAALCGLAVRP
jgi:two-component system, chemotaxis family, protein-glutamate methylesterase/glutaminase